MLFTSRSGSAAVLKTRIASLLPVVVACQTYLMFIEQGYSRVHVFRARNGPALGQSVFHRFSDLVPHVRQHMAVGV
jgi:hypothetical protein